MKKATIYPKYREQQRIFYILTMPKLIFLLTDYETFN